MARSPSRRKPWTSRQTLDIRSRIADESARIMIEDGIRDYQKAKMKAVSRIGPVDKPNLPSNREIEAILSERLRVFNGTDSRHLALRNLERAIMLMDWLGQFRPKLTGRLTTGTCTERCSIELHLFADTPEDVIHFLADNDTVFTQHERVLQQRKDQDIRVPILAVDAGHTVAELMIFSPKHERQAPISPVDRLPMRRYRRIQVEELKEKLASDAG